MKSHSTRIAVVAGCSALLWAVGATAVLAQESHIGKLVGNAAQGKQYYVRSCQGCHGPDGDGTGENAQWINPQPRDFTAGVFKCRSTMSGSLPTDQDLYNSVTRGFVNTNMPSWLPLTEQVRADLVAYIKTFSPRFKDAPAAKTLEIPPETPITSESILKGRATFQKLECWKCHGPTGHADGPSASALTDSKDNPIRPYNFSASTRFKCGTTNQDLYRIFMTGLDGTPMPGFADQLQPAEAWDLVHFLRTLQPMESQEATIWAAWVSAHPGEIKPIGPEGGSQ